MRNDDFIGLLKQKGDELYRSMPWRDDTRPYYVLVSELMLQQTQVTRVVPKFEAFIERFPDERSLAGASLAEVLKLWQGLGYNRRAKFLHEATKMIMNEYGGEFPEDEAGLLKLPGVGRNTAGAIRAYAFNQPSIFVETNIRTVYIHHFFHDRFEVDDKQIIEKLSETIDTENARSFYWAVMDYGAWLKANGVRNVANSKHYKKQPPLKGSLREARGEIIRQLTSGDKSHEELQDSVAMSDRFIQALESLERDGLLATVGDRIYLVK